MNILITGSSGFIGKNLCFALKNEKQFKVSGLHRSNLSELPNLISEADVIIHLAGENRPKNHDDFYESNVRLTKNICELISGSGKKIPIIFSSSTQVNMSNPYGQSKLAAEETLKLYYEKSKSPVRVFRLPGIFGKWAKPNFNSVVATFCNNIANNLPIEIHDRDRLIELTYIDDLVLEIIKLINDGFEGYELVTLSNTYSINLGFLADTIYKFKNTRENLMLEPVGNGFLRALYSTFLSYLSPVNFSYKIPSYSDNRGVFMEIFKTSNYGQVSFFTSLPGVVRGGHYHNTKVEKFLIVRGIATFRFKNIATKEVFETTISEKDCVVIETIPGWSHEVINVCDTDIIVILWASELFDRSNPDTYSFEVK
jgi:UDP-2-acetamido-2,6-beta-L-arabino-hexul-4-ose reductase